MVDAWPALLAGLASVILALVLSKGSLAEKAQPPSPVAVAAPPHVVGAPSLPVPVAEPSLPVPVAEPPAVIEVAAQPTTPAEERAEPAVEEPAATRSQSVRAFPSLYQEVVARTRADKDVSQLATAATPAKVATAKVVRAERLANEAAETALAAERERLSLLQSALEQLEFDH